MKFLTAHNDKIYALTRIVIGFLFAQHGAQKLFGVLGGAPAEMPAALLYSAGAIEFIGGILILVGLFTSISAFICSGTMAVAYFMVHQPKGILPILNHGELAVVYCWVFLLIAATGNGIWSVGGKEEAS